MTWLVSTSVVLLILAASISSGATLEERVTETSCKSLSLPAWSPAEREAWLRNCLGQPADFRARSEANRQISARFLRTILLESPWRDVIPFYGVRIIGAIVTGELNLDFGVLKGPLQLDHCEFRSKISMLGTTVPKQFSMVGSHFHGPLELERLEVLGPAFLRGIKTESTFSLFNARTQDALDLGGAEFASDAKLIGVVTTGFLDLRGVRAEGVNLQQAKVGRSLELAGARFAGPLTLTSIKVTGDVLVHSVVAESGLDARYAQFGELLQILDTEIEGDLILYGVSTGSHLQLADSKVSGSVDLQESRVGGRLHIHNSHTGAIDADGIDVVRDVDFSGSEIASATLVGARVGGALRLADEKGAAVWIGTGELDLRYSRFGSVDVGDLGSWPRTYRLAGLTYQRLADSTSGSDAQAMQLNHLVQWLNRAYYSPQPYDQLADVLADAGLLDDATDIRFEGRRRQIRDGTGSLLAKAGLVLLQYTVGFGYRSYYAAGWATLFVLCGWFVARRSQVGRQQGLGFFYSLDLFLPIVELRKLHYEVELETPARWYFYFHHILGFVVGTLLLAGLTVVRSGG